MATAKKLPLGEDTVLAELEFTESSGLGKANRIWRILNLKFDPDVLSVAGLKDALRESGHDETSQLVWVGLIYDEESGHTERLFWIANSNDVLQLHGLFGIPRVIKDCVEWKPLSPRFLPEFGNKETPAFFGIHGARILATKAFIEWVFEDHLLPTDGEKLVKAIESYPRDAKVALIETLGDSRGSGNSGIITAIMRSRWVYFTPTNRDVGKFLSWHEHESVPESAITMVVHKLIHAETDTPYDTYQVRIGAAAKIDPVVDWVMQTIDP